MENINYTKTEEHIQLIKDYLTKNNLDPFQLKTIEGLLHVWEIDHDEFAKQPHENSILINKNTIQMNGSGGVEFEYRSVLIDYINFYQSDWYANENEPITKELCDNYFIRENNIGTYKTYENSRKAFWSIFNKKTKTVEYGKGYVFKKNLNHKDYPLALGEQKKILTNNFYFTFINI